MEDFKLRGGLTRFNYFQNSVVSLNYSFKGFILV